MKTSEQIYAALSQRFSQRDVRWRKTEPVGSTVQLIPYIGIHAIQERLDNAVGFDGWEFALRPEQKGFVASLTLTIDGKRVTKEDGAQSDNLDLARELAFERAAAAWNIGRYLSDAPRVQVAVDAEGKYSEVPALAAEFLPDGEASQLAQASTTTSKVAEKPAAPAADKPTAPAQPAPEAAPVAAEPPAAPVEPPKAEPAAQPAPAPAPAPVAEAAPVAPSPAPAPVESVASAPSVHDKLADEAAALASLTSGAGIPAGEPGDQDYLVKGIAGKSPERLWRIPGALNADEKQLFNLKVVLDRIGQMKKETLTVFLKGDRNKNLTAEQRAWVTEVLDGIVKPLREVVV